MATYRFGPVDDVYATLVVRLHHDVSTLIWANPDHRYAIDRAILVRGDDQAAHRLGSMLPRNEVRALVRRGSRVRPDPNAEGATRA